MKYLKLDKSYDLFISMTWSGDTNHGISGHLYEIIEYYFILKDKFKVGILICEDMTWETIEKAITTKYNLNEELIKQIKLNTLFANRPKYVTGNNILFVDGGFTRTMLRYGVTLLFKNIFSFRCSNKDFHYNLPYKNITLLQDQRVYNDNDSEISINYKKKINFDIFKNLSKNILETALLYVTSNCRKICDDYLLDIIVNNNFDNYIILSNENGKYKRRYKEFKNLNFPEMPVKNIFELFGTYIYTPTYLGKGQKAESFDCSPRFIAECKYFNKNIIYHDIDSKYLEKDTGLKYRIQDINNNFDSIKLKDNDEIIEILKKRL